MTMPDYEGAIYLPSQFYSKPVRPRSIRAIVIHSAECQETESAAKNVANWFRDERAKVSAHYIVDSGNIVQSVLESNIAWHAGAANTWSIGVEIAGKASQTRAQWLDTYSLKTLKLAGKLVAARAKVRGIRLEHYAVADLPNPNMTGIAAHVDINAAFYKGKGHYDPGPFFPWDDFLQICRDAS